MDKLNKTFINGEILTSVNMNNIVNKTNELVDFANNTVGNIAKTLDDINGEVI